MIELELSIATANAYLGVKALELAFISLLLFTAFLLIFVKAEAGGEGACCNDNDYDVVVVVIDEDVIFDCSDKEDVVAVTTSFGSHGLTDFIIFNDTRLLR